MSKLPEDLTNRFFLYLSVLPVVEKVLMYTFFCIGVMFLLGSISRILLLNWDLQKQCANMDFSHGNSKELKRIHLKRMKSREKWPASDTKSAAEAFYASLLVPSADDNLEYGLNSTEMEVLANDANKICNNITRSPKVGIDNYSCDKVESCQTECDVFNTCDLKEANV
jgi:hypothetical protein